MVPDWYGRPYHMAAIWLGVSKLLSARARLRHYLPQCPLHLRCICPCLDPDAFLGPAHAASSLPIRSGLRSLTYRNWKLFQMCCPRTGASSQHLSRLISQHHIPSCLRCFLTPRTKLGPSVASNPTPRTKFCP